MNIVTKGSIWGWLVWVLGSSELIPGSVMVCVTQSCYLASLSLCEMQGMMLTYLLPLRRNVRVITGEARCLYWIITGAMSVQNTKILNLAVSLSLASK